VIEGLASWLESTPLSLTIRSSVLLTGLLSGFHLVGMTLIGGSALVSGLRLLGAAFSDFPGTAVIATARRLTGIGIAVSIVTGLLLVAPRASTAIVSEYFQWKMLLLAAAIGFHFSIARAATAPPAASTPVARLSGAVTIALWFAVIAAGCAFILLEG
jgi:hypothetical protein